MVVSLTTVAPVTSTVPIISKDSEVEIVTVKGPPIESDSTSTLTGSASSASSSSSNCGYNSSDEERTKDIASGRNNHTVNELSNSSETETGIIDSSEENSNTVNLNDPGSSSNSSSLNNSLKNSHSVKTTISNGIQNSNGNSDAGSPLTEDNDSRDANSYTDDNSESQRLGLPGLGVGVDSNDIDNDNLDMIQNVSEAIIAEIVSSSVSNGNRVIDSTVNLNSKDDKIIMSTNPLDALVKQVENEQIKPSELNTNSFGQELIMPDSNHIIQNQGVNTNNSSDELLISNFDSSENNNQQNFANDPNLNSNLIRPTGPTTSTTRNGQTPSRIPLPPGALSSQGLKNPNVTGSEKPSIAEQGSVSDLGPKVKVQIQNKPTLQDDRTYSLDTVVTGTGNSNSGSGLGNNNMVTSQQESSLSLSGSSDTSNKIPVNNTADNDTNCTITIEASAASQIDTIDTIESSIRNQDGSDSHSESEQTVVTVTSDTDADASEVGPDQDHDDDDLEFPPNDNGPLITDFDRQDMIDNGLQDQQQVTGPSQLPLGPLAPISNLGQFAGGANPQTLTMNNESSMDSNNNNNSSNPKFQLDLETSNATLREKLKERNQQKRDLLNELMEARQLVWQYKQEANRAKQGLKALLIGNQQSDSQQSQKSDNNESSLNNSSDSDSQTQQQQGKSNTNSNSQQPAPSELTNSINQENILDVGITATIPDSDMSPEEFLEQESQMAMGGGKGNSIGKGKGGKGAFKGGFQQSYEDGPGGGPFGSSGSNSMSSSLSGTLSPRGAGSKSGGKGVTGLSYNSSNSMRRSSSTGAVERGGDKELQYMTVQQYVESQDRELRKSISKLSEARMVAHAYLRMVDERTDIIRALELELESTRKKHDLKQLQDQYHPSGEVFISEKSQAMRGGSGGHEGGALGVMASIGGPGMGLFSGINKQSSSDNPMTAASKGQTDSESDSDTTADRNSTALLTTVTQSSESDSESIKSQTSSQSEICDSTGLTTTALSAGIPVPQDPPGLASLTPQALNNMQRMKIGPTGLFALREDVNEENKEERDLVENVMGGKRFNYHNISIGSTEGDQGQEQSYVSPEQLQILAMIVETSSMRKAFMSLKHAVSQQKAALKMQANFRRWLVYSDSISSSDKKVGKDNDLNDSSVNGSKEDESDSSDTATDSTGITASSTTTTSSESTKHNKLKPIINSSTKSSVTIPSSIIIPKYRSKSLPTKQSAVRLSPRTRKAEFFEKKRQEKNQYQAIKSIIKITEKISQHISDKSFTLTLEKDEDDCKRRVLQHCKSFLGVHFAVELIQAQFRVKLSRQYLGELYEEDQERRRREIAERELRELEFSSSSQMARAAAGGGGGPGSGSMGLNQQQPLGSNNLKQREPIPTIPQSMRDLRRAEMMNNSMHNSMNNRKNNSNNYDRSGQSGSGQPHQLPVEDFSQAEFRESFSMSRSRDNNYNVNVRDDMNYNGHHNRSERESRNNNLNNSFNNSHTFSSFNSSVQSIDHYNHGTNNTRGGPSNRYDRDHRPVDRYNNHGNQNQNLANNFQGNHNVGDRESNLQHRESRSLNRSRSQRSRSHSRDRNFDMMSESSYYQNQNNNNNLNRTRRGAPFHDDFLSELSRENNHKLNHNMQNQNQNNQSSSQNFQNHNNQNQSQHNSNMRNNSKNRSRPPWNDSTSTADGAGLSGVRHGHQPHPGLQQQQQNQDQYHNHSHNNSINLNQIQNQNQSRRNSHSSQGNTNTNNNINNSNNANFLKLPPTNHHEPRHNSTRGSGPQGPGHRSAYGRQQWAAEINQQNGNNNLNSVNNNHNGAQQRLNTTGGPGHSRHKTLPSRSSTISTSGSSTGVMSRAGSRRHINTAPIGQSNMQHNHSHSQQPNNVYVNTRQFFDSAQNSRGMSQGNILSNNNNNSRRSGRPSGQNQQGQNNNSRSQSQNFKTYYKNHNSIDEYNNNGDHSSRSASHSPSPQYQQYNGPLANANNRSYHENFQDSSSPPINSISRNLNLTDFDMIQPENENPNGRKLSKAHPMYNRVPSVGQKRGLKQYSGNQPLQKTSSRGPGATYLNHNPVEGSENVKASPPSTSMSRLPLAALKKKINESSPPSSTAQSHLHNHHHYHVFVPEKDIANIGKNKDISKEHHDDDHDDTNLDQDGDSTDTRPKTTPGSISVP